MNKFKVGDKIRRRVMHSLLTVGDVYVVSDSDGSGRTLKLEGIDKLAIFSAEYFDLVTAVKTPHKHAELIRAWADGAVVECRFLATKTDWSVTDTPMWADCFEYRIKPEPKPDRVVPWGNVSLLELGSVMFTVDGETGKIKSVELKK